MSATARAKKFHFTRLLLAIAAVGAASSAAEPPTDWVDPDTGHRVIRISPQPGSASLYFHQNTYTLEGDKMIFDRVLRLLREREQIYERAVPLLSLSYGEYPSNVKAFRDEIEKSPNPFVAETTPAFLKSRQREFRILATLTMVRAAIQYKLHGVGGLQSVDDPCGQGPFTFQRFVFEGVDRGFELRSGFDLDKNIVVLIFVEKEGPPFQVDGNFPGRPLPKVVPQP